MGLQDLFKGAKTTPAQANGYFTNAPEITALNNLFGRECQAVIMPDLKIKAGQFNQSAKRKCYLASIPQILCHAFDTDAQLQPVFIPSVIQEGQETWRVSIDLVSKYDCFVDCLFIDFDAKKDGQKWAWSDEDFKAAVITFRENAILANCVFYKTKHGLRGIIPLENRYSLKKEYHGRDWTFIYEYMLKQLPKTDLGVFDVACTDAVKTFRAPNVIRDGEKLSSLFWIPGTLSTFKIDYDDLFYSTSAYHAKTTNSKGYKGLVQVFKEADLYVEEINKKYNEESMHRVICPWASLHSSVDPKSTASVLFADGNGGYVFDCKHASCKDERKKPNALKNRFPDLFDKNVSESFEFLLDEINAEELCENIATVLRSEKDQPFFKRGTGIVRVIYDIAVEQYRIVSVSKEEIASFLDHKSRWYKQTMGKDGGWVKNYMILSVDKIINRHLTSIRDLLPLLNSISSLPPINEAFEPLLEARGFCESQGVYFTPSKNFNLASLRNIPNSIEEAKAAARRLLDLFVDFPFASESHKLVALSCMFTAAFRKKIEASAPMYLVSANAPGAGKTRLLSSILAGVTGLTGINLMPIPNKEEELEKMINGAIFQGDDYVLFDNISSLFGGGHMDAILTSNVLSLRRLGTTGQSPIKIRTFFAGTGNNAILKGDTHRRTITVRLVTELDDPSERRDFKHDNIEQYCADRVGEIWRDMLTIQRAYLEYANKDNVKNAIKAFGSYEIWGDWVQKPISWIGALLELPQFDIVELSKQETISRDVDEVASLFTSLLTFQNAFEAQKGEGGWLGNDLCEAFRAKTDKDEHLQSIYDLLFGGIGSFNVINLGRKLIKYKDKIVQGVKFTVTIDRTNKKIYRLVKTEAKPPLITAPSTPAPSTPAPSTPAPSTPAPQAKAFNADWLSCGTMGDNGTCTFLTEGKMCLRDRVSCEYDLELVNITEPIAKPFVKIEEKSLFTEDTSIYTPALKTRIYDLLCVGRTQKDIADILTKERFKSAGKPWSSSSVGEAIRHFGISKQQIKAKPNPIEEKINARGGYDDASWPQYAPKTRISIETYLENNEMGQPIGGQTMQGTKTTVGAYDMLKSALNVSSIQDALARATTPAQREAKAQIKNSTKA